MNSLDQKLINNVAEIWVDGGGDADGIVWLWQLIRDRVAEIIEERESLKYMEVK